MKRPLIIVLAVAALSGCSIRQAAFNSAADMLAPPPRAKPAKAAEKENLTDPMIALTGENDPELVRDFFPTALKLYEILHLQNPEHEGLAIMTGQLYVMYANAFVQTPAEQLPGDRFDEQNEAYRRAENFYLRGSRFTLEALDGKHPAFSAAVFGQDEKAAAGALARCKKTDTAALYWTGAGALGAFSLDPLNTNLLSILPGSVAMLERASILDPGFNNGAIWEILMSFYAAAPDSLGGGRDKAMAAYEKALHYSRGTSPGTHIGYARSFCIPAQDGAGFDEAIEKALAIDPESQSDNRLVLTIARRQALWLKAHKADYILE